MSTKSPVFIIDGSSFLYRAYYGMRPLQTSQGIPVQAVYSFCRMIRKLIKDFNIEHIVVVWDSKGKNARHLMYPDYKATRQQAPLDLYEQKNLIIEFLEIIKIAQVSQVGVEADDLIASLAEKFNHLGHQIMIVSGDKDLAQIVTNDSIKIFDAFKDQIFDEQKLMLQYGFPLAKLPFYFSLLGDASDNIPGVKGIGKKGATDLVLQFKSLDDLYANIDKIDKRKIKESLLAQKENAYLSFQLFTLRIYETATTIQDTLFDESNWNLVVTFLQKLEFNSLIADIEKKSSQKNIENSIGQYSVQQAHAQLHEIYDFMLVTDLDDLIKIKNEIVRVGEFAVDTETTGLDAMVDTCVGISIAIQPGSAYYIPFGHVTDQQQLSVQNVIDQLGSVFASESIKKYLHHAQFDQIVLYRLGMPLHGVVFDTLIAASLLVQDWQKKGLKTLSEFYFHETMIDYDQIVKKHKAKNFSYVPLLDATEYAAADAHQTLKLKRFFYDQLVEQKLLDLFQSIEMPVHNVLVQMQIEGIYCNKSVLEYLDTLVESDLKLIEADIANYVDGPLNLNSPKQVKELLFDRLNLPVQKKSAKKTGYSTDAQVLQILSKIHPVPGLLLKYRELFKLKSTYIESLPEFINPETGKIHTSFHQALVATGRLSSSHPNLQNIPTSSFGYPVDIRTSFQAEPGFVLLSADYSQIELRILAYLSQDQALLQAFNQEKDIHAQTASKLFQTDDISSEQRTVGKTINFSILYGLTSFGLSKSLEISYKDAQKYIAMYFEQYPGIVRWIDATVKFAKEHGYVQTLFGRKRYVPGIYEKNRMLFDVAKRIAVNSPVQGTSAEIMKLGMIRLYENLKNHNLQAKILLQIHDELILSVPEGQIDQTALIVKDSLQSVVSWNVPLIVNIQTGLNWHDVTK